MSLRKVCPQCNTLVHVKRSVVGVDMLSHLNVLSCLAIKSTALRV